MSEKTALVITSIAASDHPVLQSYADRCKKEGIPFYVMGDKISPPDFKLDGCEFYSLDRQRATGFDLVKDLPERHYGRKNIGYLVAISEGAGVILETDDDNYAREDFWQLRQRDIRARIIKDAGWFNVYACFTDTRIWPRGFALEHLMDPVPAASGFPMESVNSPIQQGLADENPDVDAMYRLTLPLPVSFEKEESLALGNNTWCPFNSQNTTWFREAFPLMYLPSHCSFRMTDIWRSFIAQRIAWENGWFVWFHKPTVYQERNMHSLMRDFSDEIIGYMNNKSIALRLQGLKLTAGMKSLGDNLFKCYEVLVSMKLIGEAELPLLESWINDLKRLGIEI